MTYDGQLFIEPKPTPPRESIGFADRYHTEPDFFGTCKAFIAIDQPECGVPATVVVQVRTRQVHAFVPLCDKHKAEHDRIAAEIRASRKMPRQ